MEEIHGEGVDQAVGSYISEEVHVWLQCRGLSKVSGDATDLYSRAFLRRHEIKSQIGI